VPVIEIGPLRRRFPIADLRGADLHAHFVFAPHPLDVDIQVQFAHARQDDLAGLLVVEDAEGRVLFAETGQRLAHLVGVRPTLRLDRDLDHRARVTRWINLPAGRSEATWLVDPIVLARLVRVPYYVFVGRKPALTAAGENGGR
jgi:hypothetical protein